MVSAILKKNGIECEFSLETKKLYLENSQKIMRLTKRDIALTKISIPAAIHSVYFRGKRYSYNDYLKIMKQADKNTSKEE